MDEATFFAKHEKYKCSCFSRMWFKNEKYQFSNYLIRGQIRLLEETTYDEMIFFMQSIKM